jgi:methanogenic corrinoid protein MtbC1
MQAVHVKAAEAIEAVSRVLAEWTVDQHVSEDPSLETRYGPETRRLWRGDVLARVAHLVEAVAADEPGLFVASASWSRAAFLARDMGDDDVLRSLRCLRTVLGENLPVDVSVRAAAIIDAAIEAMQSHPGQIESPLEHLGSEGTLGRLYLMHLLQRDRDEAERIVQEQLDGNMPLADIYERILSPAMNEIGHMWHLREASIADEHYCTASTQAIAARLRGQVRRKSPNGLVAVACCSGGDLHDLGIRMVADLFEVEGWSVECLGANMPADDVCEAVGEQAHRHAADLLLVSAGTPLAVRGVAGLIARVRTGHAHGAPAVLVGGLPFHLAPNLWRKVGADGFAARAGAAPRAGLDLVRARRAAPRR